MNPEGRLTFAVTAPRCPGAWLVALAITILSGCAGDRPVRESLPPRPADVRAQITKLIPATTTDRAGWAVDIYAALAALEVTPTTENICAVLAVTEQESSFRADPEVPRLGRIARDEIDRRAERLGIPALAVQLALKLPSSNGKSFADRVDTVRTERELSLIYEEFIAMAPLGKRLFASWNPVHTGGPMQVSIAFAEAHARQRHYPYAVADSIRHEVFTRRGGLYFGIAHLLDYPANYDTHLYRFADFNAGRYASRNAAFQNAVTVASGIPLELDGDLVRHGDGAEDNPGSTELAVRSIGKRLDLGNGTIRQMLEQGDALEFERSALYQGVFELADRLERRQLPRALLPKIPLRSPKISRKLTTEWFANRVDERYRKCLSRAAAPATTAPAP